MLYIYETKEDIVNQTISWAWAAVMGNSVACYSLFPLVLSPFELVHTYEHLVWNNDTTYMLKLNVCILQN